MGVDGDSRANLLVDLDENQPQLLECRVPESCYLQFQAPVTIFRAAWEKSHCLRLYLHKIVFYYST